MSDQEHSSEDKQSEENQPAEEEQLLLHHDLAPNNSEVQSLNSRLDYTTNKSVGFQLPFRHNRGKPPSRYSPDCEKKEKKGIPLPTTWVLRNCHSP